METFFQILASFDIFQIILNSFPAIINPIIKGFESIYHQIFPSIKNLVEHYPSMTFGSLILILAYSGYTFVQWIMKPRLASVRK